jgi:hypothetical protein
MPPTPEHQQRARIFGVLFGLTCDLSITVYTIVKGFRPSPILDDSRYAGP